jgi:osmotically-inducible protein OsmY
VVRWAASLPVARRLEVGATHGVIRLRGKVGDDKERTLALGLCWLIPEVQEVHDLLQLEEGTAAADQPSQPAKQ